MKFFTEQAESNSAEVMDSYTSGSCEYRSMCVVDFLALVL